MMIDVLAAGVSGVSGEDELDVMTETGSMSTDQIGVTSSRRLRAVRFV